MPDGQAVESKSTSSAAEILEVPLARGTTTPASLALPLILWATHHLQLY